MYFFIIYSTKFKVALGTLMRWRQYILVTGDREYLQTPSWKHAVLCTLHTEYTFESVFCIPFSLLLPFTHNSPIPLKTCIFPREETMRP